MSVAQKCPCQVAIVCVLVSYGILCGCDAQLSMASLILLVWASRTKSYTEAEVRGWPRLLASLASQDGQAMLESEAG